MVGVGLGAVGPLLARVVVDDAVVGSTAVLVPVVTALVVIRIMTQFLAQTLGIIVLRTRRPDFPRPFRMWLYPLPALLAFGGYVYTVVMRPKSIESIRLALLVVVVVTILFWLRQRQTGPAKVEV